MNLEEIKASIVALVNKFIAIQPNVDIPETKPLGVPGSYIILQQQCLVTELCDETKKLLDVINHPHLNLQSLQDEFKKLCAERELQNQASSLSYSAIPNGACNELYWQVAVRLFEPKNLGEMLAILLPSVKQLIKLEMAVAPPAETVSKQMEDKVKITLALQPLLTNMSHIPCELSKLSEFVIGNGVIFPVDEIANLSLALHIKVVELLAQYPQLRQVLYQYNDDLKQLSIDMEWVNEKGTTPHAAITRLIVELTHAGTRYTGSEFAAISALIAFEQFKTYLSQLPKDFHDKLLALKGDNNKTLEDIIAGLNKMGCVETAASNLTCLQAVANNQALLTSQPFNTGEALKIIKVKYNGKHSLTLSGYDSTSVLPVALRKKVFKSINIQSTGDYLDLLLNLPASEYDVLLEDATISLQPPLSNQLVEILTWVTLEQRTAFVNAVIKHAKKMGGKLEVWSFAMANRMFDLQQAWHEEKDKLALLKEKDYHDNTFLHLVAKYKNLEFLRNILLFMPEKDRGDAVSKENIYRNSILSILITMEDKKMLREILLLIPNKDKLEVITKKIRNNDHGDTILHVLARENWQDMLCELLTLYPEQSRGAVLYNTLSEDGANILGILLHSKDTGMLCAILPLLPEEQRLGVLIARGIRTGWKTTVLHNFVKHCDINRLRKILLLIPKKDRLAAVSCTDEFSDTILHLAAHNKNSDMLYEILLQLPGKDRLVAVKLTNSDNVTVLHIIARYIDLEMLRVLILLYPKQERADVILDNQDHNSILYIVATRDDNPKNLRKILSFIPKCKWQAVTNDVLHITAEYNQPNKFHEILMFIPEQYRLDAIKQTDQYDNTALHCVAKKCNVETFLEILSLYPENERCAAVNQVNSDGSNLLHLAAEYNDWAMLSAILKIYPETDKLAAIKKQSKFRGTVLHCAANNYNPENLRELLRLYPIQERLALLTDLNNNGQTVLESKLVYHYNPEMLRALSQVLSAEDMLAALSLQGKNKRIIDYYHQENGYSSVIAVLDEIVEIASKIIAFQQIYQTMNKSNEINFLADKQYISMDDMQQKIMAYIQSSADTVTKAWELAQIHYADPSNNNQALLAAIMQYADAKPASGGAATFFKKRKHDSEDHSTTAVSPDDKKRRKQKN